MQHWTALIQNGIESKNVQEYECCIAVSKDHSGCEDSLDGVEDSEHGCKERHCCIDSVDSRYELLMYEKRAHEDENAKSGPNAKVRSNVGGRTPIAGFVVRWR